MSWLNLIKCLFYFITFLKMRVILKVLRSKSIDLPTIVRLLKQPQYKPSHAVSKDVLWLKWYHDLSVENDLRLYKSTVWHLPVAPAVMPVSCGILPAQNHPPPSPPQASLLYSHGLDGLRLWGLGADIVSGAKDHMEQAIAENVRGWLSVAMRYREGERESQEKSKGHCSS